MEPARRKNRKRMIIAIAVIMTQLASGMVFSYVLEREDKPPEQWHPNDLQWIEDQALFLVTNRHFSFSINTQEENAHVLSDDPLVCSIPSFLLQVSRVGRGNDADNPVLAAFKNEKRKLNSLELVLGLDKPRRWMALRKQRENLRRQYRRILFCREDGGFGIVSMSRMTDRNFALVQFSNCSQGAWMEVHIDITEEVDVSELEELCRCIASTIHFQDGSGAVPSPAEFDFGGRTERERPVPTAMLENVGVRTVSVVEPARTCESTAQPVAGQSGERQSAPPNPEALP